MKKTIIAALFILTTFPFVSQAEEPLPLPEIINLPYSIDSATGHIARTPCQRIMSEIEKVREEIKDNKGNVQIHIGEIKAYYKSLSIMGCSYDDQD